MTDLTLRAWAYLSRVVEPPCAELAALVDRVGPVEAAERVRRGQVDDSLAHRTAARREIDRAADDLEWLARRHLPSCLLPAMSMYLAEQCRKVRVDERAHRRVLSPGD